MPFRIAEDRRGKRVAADRRMHSLQHRRAQRLYRNARMVDQGGRFERGDLDRAEQIKIIGIDIRPQPKGPDGMAENEGECRRDDRQRR